jgi:hypothetical protein
MVHVRISTLLRHGLGGAKHSLRKTLAEGEDISCVTDGTLGCFGQMGRLALLCTFCQPATERALTFARRLPEQNILCTDVFIQVRPVYAFSFPNQPPVIPFPTLAIQKPGIPGQGCGNSTPIDQVNDKCVIRHRDILYCSCSYLNRQRTHSNSSTSGPCFLRQAVGCD